MLEQLTRAINDAADGLLVVVHHGMATQVFRKVNGVIVSSYPKRKFGEVRDVQAEEPALPMVPMSYLFGLEDVGIGTSILLVEEDVETVFEKKQDGWIISGITMQAAAA